MESDPSVKKLLATAETEGDLAAHACVWRISECLLTVKTDGLENWSLTILCFGM